MKEVRGYIMIMGAAFFWGVSATAAKFLLNQQLDTLLIVQSRVSFSCLLMFVYYLLFKRHLLRVVPKDLWRFALLGILGVAGANFTYYFTIKESTVATGILIQYTAPLFVMAYAAIAREEKTTAVKLVAAVVSLFGCFLAVGGYGTAQLRISPIVLVSGAGSVFSFAFMNIFTRHILKKYNVWTLTFYAIAFASLFWLILSPPWRIVGIAPSRDVWWAMAGLAVISVLIPHTLYFGGLRFIVPSRAVITSTLEPVVAIASAAVILGEYLEQVQVVGAALVILAIVLLQLRRETAPGNTVEPPNSNNINGAELPTQ
jgi:drug/metabolite transporter (DMT)-like permease